MRAAVEGIYNEGKVILNESIDFKGKAKVLVVVLEDIDEKKARRERLLSTFSSWNDNRTSEEIVTDIYSSRVSRKEDISL